MSPAARCYKARAKHTSSRELVQTSTRASNGNHVQVLGTRVIGAVDHGTHRETERHSELVSSSTSTSYGLTLREGALTTLSSSSHSWIRELYGERTADGGPPEYLQNRGRRLFSHCVLSTNRNHSSSLSDRYRQSASRGRSSSATLERERHRLSNSFWRATPSRGTSNRLFIRILTHSMGSGRSGTDSTRTLRINDFTPSTTTEYSVRIPYMARPQTDQSGVPPFRDCEDQTEHRATTCES